MRGSSLRTAVLLLTIAARPAALLAQCGVERWSVKTGTDADVGLVNVSSSSASAITTMRGWTAPNPIPANNRVSPYETTVWVLNATLTQYKLESDSDYHLILSDASGNTMIAEIPSPSCVGAGSPFTSGISNSRSEFNARYTPSGSFQTANIPVQIKGVGMFDFLHGQTGVAPNGIELHPVLDVIFNPATNPDFSMATNPTSTTIGQGTSGNVSVSTSALNGFNSSIALSASGLPTGATATLTPSSIAAPGTGSSTMAIAVGPSTPAGTYPVTVAGSGGGKSHTSSVSLAVTPAGGGGSILNGGFETGSISGWTSAGTTGIVTTAHSGSYAARVGSTAASTDSSLAQTFTLPAGSPQLSFWYKSVCPDTVTYDWSTATLKDNVTNSTSTVLAKTCTNTGAWVNVGFSASASAGHSVTLTLSNHDDNYSGDPTYTLYDDVTVSGSTGDTTPPTTSISAPANGATVSGTTTITATASDNVGVTKVEIYVDGVLKTSLTSSPYSYAWATTTYANGSHTASSKAYDAAGNVGTSATVTVTVSNGGATQQLLANPGFETGTASPWVTSTGVVDNSASEAAHSGSWKAWMDGYGTAHTDTLYQQVAIPSTATTATLTFWLHIDTAETGTTAYDTLTVQIRNSSGTVLGTLATYSNVNAATGYVQKSFNLGSYIGQTIRVYLVGTEDSSNQTSFVVDDFALNVQ